jgi:hypothetical protein
MKHVVHASVLALLVTGCAGSPVQPTVGTTTFISANERSSEIGSTERASAPATLQRADTIKLRDGYVDVGDRISASLKGTSGFSTDTLVLHRTGILPSDNCNFDPNRCRPGLSLPLHALWTVPDISGNVKLQGHTYQLGVNTTQCASMGLELSGSYSLPVEAVAATVTVPFALTGWIDCGDGRQALEGSGMATLDLTWTAASAAWHVKTIRFELF